MHDGNQKGTAAQASKPIIPGVYGFRGNHSFLSNFEPAPVVFEGYEYPTVEHAYQAAKFPIGHARTAIAGMLTPGQAKRAGRKLGPIRDDWEDIKVDVMERLLRQKFQIPELREQLLAPEGFYLEETNTWGDTFWGVCNGKGKNILGLLLMKIREELAD